MGKPQTKCHERVVSKYGAYIAHLTSLICDSSVKASDRAKLTRYARKWLDAKYLLGCAVLWTSSHLVPLFQSP